MINNFDLMEHEYSISENGKLVTVPTFDKCMDSIKRRYERLKIRINTLEEENKILRSEHYKDDEIQKMKEERDIAIKNAHNGFPMTEKEINTIKKWKKEHEKEVHNITTDDQRIQSGGAIGGTYTYSFRPTTIGTIGIIKCSCGKEFVFRTIN